jgi:hypothetical protein
MERGAEVAASVRTLVPRRNSDLFSLMVRSAGDARASRTMAARASRTMAAHAALPGPHPSRRPARAGLLRIRWSVLSSSKSQCQGTRLIRWARLRKINLPHAANRRTICYAEPRLV